MKILNHPNIGEFELEPDNQLKQLTDGFHKEIVKDYHYILLFYNGGN